MGRYTEMLLRFMHVLANRRAKVSCFLFGTRLTNVTRALRHREPHPPQDPTLYASHAYR